MKEFLGYTYTEEDEKLLKLTPTKLIKEEGFEVVEKDISDEYSYILQNTKLQKVIICGKKREHIIADMHTTLVANGYLDINEENNGYGFLRDLSLKPTPADIYISSNMIKMFGLKMGDRVIGFAKKNDESKFPPLVYTIAINGNSVEKSFNLIKFDQLTPIYPTQRLEIEKTGAISNRIISLFAPIGKGQRGLIVSQPKAGKTTILKQIAASFKQMDDIELMVLLIDERPEEVTEIEEIVKGHVISSTFDQKPQNHIYMAEFAIDIAKQKVASGKHVVLLLDSITRLARAYNLVVPSSGKVLTGGFDPNALYRPKKFFGAARNTKEAGSLTIIATALVDTGSKMDDLIYEEFKGTGNMELHLDRDIADLRIYPAINILKSGTRRDDLLLSAKDKEKIDKIRQGLASKHHAEGIKEVISLIENTKDNEQFLDLFNNVQ